MNCHRERQGNRQDPVKKLCWGIKHFIVALGITIFLALYAVSCASTPKYEAFFEGRQNFARMAAGADIYLRADVKKAGPIVEHLVLGGLSIAEARDFLGMADTLTAAIFRNSGQEGSRFYAAAQGKFPSARGGLFLSASKDWEKQPSAAGVDYWRSEKSKLSVFLGPRQAYLSSGDPFAPGPGAEIPAVPPGIEALLQRGPALFGWVENPGEALRRIAAAFGAPVQIPARRLFFAVYPLLKEENKRKTQEEQNYTALLVLETPTASQAGALARIFTLARAGLSAVDFSARPALKTLAQAFFAENPRQEDNFLLVSSGVLSGQDIALLFNTISLY